MVETLFKMISIWKRRRDCDYELSFINTFIDNYETDYPSLHAVLKDIRFLTKSLILRCVVDTSAVFAFNQDKVGNITTVIDFACKDDDSTHTTVLKVRDFFNHIINTTQKVK